MKVEQALQEIKEIIQYDDNTPRAGFCIRLNWIKKKIKEVEDV